MRGWGIPALRSVIEFLMEVGFFEGDNLRPARTRLRNLVARECGEGFAKRVHLASSLLRGDRLRVTGISTMVAVKLNVY